MGLPTSGTVSNQLLSGLLTGGGDKDTLPVLGALEKTTLLLVTGTFDQIATYFGFLFGLWEI